MPSPRVITIPVSPTGSAGSATATVTTLDLGLNVAVGWITGVRVVYTSAPATTDIIISELGGEFTRTLLKLTDANTSGYWYPTVALTDSEGAAFTPATPNLIYLSGCHLSVVVTGANAVANAVIVYIQLSEVF